jgi:hypothetical protein
MVRERPIMRRAMMLLGGNSEGAAEVAGMTQQPGDIRAKGVWAAGQTAIKRDTQKPQRSLFVRPSGIFPKSSATRSIAAFLPTAADGPDRHTAPKHSNRNQDWHDNHHRRGNLPLPRNGLWLFIKGMRSYSSAISASAFDPEASLAQGCILSSQLVDLSLELGDFIKFRHSTE